jgi:two-component system, chemotaxis family, chemotaxis protein CheY
MRDDADLPILVVDDFGTMVRIIKKLLKQIGYENVDDASDGAAAYEKIQKKQYGLVISDWHMSPMSGFELLRKIRSDAHAASTKFIMVTAASTTADIVAAQEAGADTYIVKPFDAPTLRSKIDQTLGIPAEV